MQFWCLPHTCLVGGYSLRICDDGLLAVCSSFYGLCFLCPGCGLVLSSPIPVNEEDNFEPVFETQEEQREHANQWRDAIAANMWNDVERFNNNEQ